MLSLLPLVGALPSVGVEPVRKVTFRQTPEMKELAERVRQIGNEMYPKILALLGDNTAKLPRQFDIVFKKKLSRPELRDIGTLEGCVKGMNGTVVYLNAESLAWNSTNLDIFLHEMAHVGILLRAPDNVKAQFPQPARESLSEFKAVETHGELMGFVKDAMG
jgi:hypothetical protein